MKIICIEKQWGGTNKKKNGRLLDGKEYNEMPKPEVVL
jgi:protein gp37